MVNVRLGSLGVVEEWFGAVNRGEGIGVVLNQGGAESGPRARWRPQAVREGAGEGWPGSG